MKALTYALFALGFIGSYAAWDTYQTKKTDAKLMQLKSELALSIAQDAQDDTDDSLKPLSAVFSEKMIAIMNQINALEQKDPIKTIEITAPNGNVILFSPKKN